MRHITVTVLAAILTAPAHASGWHDYRLEIAPGFAVERMNSFEVCLAGPDGSLIICPDDPPVFGPIVSYAVTADSILTRHLGAKPNERNLSMWDADPTTELYFRVNRSNLRVDGPYSRAAWQQAGLQSLSSVTWTEPKNPNFWIPLLGTVYFLFMAAYVLVWPLVLLVILVVGGILLWVVRRRRRTSRAAV
jgi:hypothetical protein